MELCYLLTLNVMHECYGLFVLISNEVKDPVMALSLYRMRDVVEKAFWIAKEWRNLQRTMTSSERSQEGKLFVEFIALIYLSYIRQKMEEMETLRNLYHARIAG